MPRQPGEFRTALFGAAQQLRDAQRDFSVYDLARVSQVQLGVAMRTTENMARAGVLVVVGKSKRADQCGWINVYELPEPEVGAPAEPAPAEQLAAVTASWVNFE